MSKRACVPRPTLFLSQVTPKDSMACYPMTSLNFCTRESANQANPWGYLLQHVINELHLLISLYILCFMCIYDSKNPTKLIL